MSASDRYVLSVLIEDTGDAISFASPTPFQAISRGDLFDTTGWYDLGDLRGKPARVVYVEHVVGQVSEDKPAFHQVRVYTKLVDKGEAQREGRPEIGEDPIA